MGEKVHGLRGVVRQEGGGVMALEYFFGTLEGGFRVAVVAQYLARFAGSFFHRGGVLFRVLQPCLCLNLAPFVGWAGFGLKGFEGFPNDVQRFFSVYDFPRCGADDCDELPEGVGVGPAGFLTVGICLEGKHFFDAAVLIAFLMRV